MGSSSNRIVFLLMSYNQEAFIAEAVASAFAQDFVPLEIVITDDCSPDGTFAIIERLVADYGGPHRVRTNRNAVRLGSVDHIASIVETIGDAFIIVAHGDDISLPERTRVLVDAWRKRRVSMVSSGARWINSTGSRDAGHRRSRYITAEEMLEADWLPELLGAALACESTVFSQFARLSGHALACGLDHVLPLRSAALRGFYYVSDQLLAYRRHSDNMSNTICDRSASDDVFEEGLAAYNLAIRAFQHSDIASHVAQGRFNWRSKRLLKRLQRKIVEDARGWSVIRSGIVRQGLISTWRPSAEIKARNTKFEVSF